MIEILLQVFMTRRGKMEYPAIFKHLGQRKKVFFKKGKESKQNNVKNEGQPPPQNKAEKTWKRPLYIVIDTRTKD